MKDSLSTTGGATDRISNRQMAEGLRGALEKNYGRILHEADAEWNRSFAGRDPSDACIKVNVSADWGPVLIPRATRVQPVLTFAPQGS